MQLFEKLHAKSMWLFLVLVIAFSECKCWSIPIIFEEDEFLQKRCEKNANIKTYVELQNATTNLIPCMMVVPPPLNQFDILDKLCFHVPAVARSCMKNVLDKMEMCMDPEERYLNSFIVTNFNKSIENFCKNDGKLMIEHFSNIARVQCDVHAETVHSIVARNCLPKFNDTHKLKRADFVMTRSYFCKNVKFGTRCVMDALNVHCKDGVLTNLLRDFYEPYLDWCSKNGSQSYPIMNCLKILFLSSLISLVYVPLLVFKLHG